MLTLDQIYTRLISGIESAGGVELSSGAQDAVLAWCNGTARDGSPRREIFDRREGQAAAVLIVRRLRTKGEKILGLSAGGVLDSDGIRKLELDLWSATILCDPKPDPDPGPRAAPGPDLAATRRLW